MWKKDEVNPPTGNGQTEATPRPERSSSGFAAASSDRATIGRSIAIRGDVTGDEDLVIQGRVEGSVNLQQHSVTIGPEGEVKASVVGKVVTVEGKVEGNIQADEQVILRTSAIVQGDITAPRVVLEDGARFRGGVDMGEVGDRGKRPTTPAPAEARKGSDRSRPASEPAGQSGPGILSTAAKTPSTNETAVEVSN